MKCMDCSYAELSKYKGGINRWYCENRAVKNEINAGRELICKCKRHSEELTIKTSPKWCPFKRGGAVDAK